MVMAISSLLYLGIPLTRKQTPYIMNGKMLKYDRNK